jgi:hypothetical protein
MNNEKNKIIFLDIDGPIITSNLSAFQIDRSQHNPKTIENLLSLVYLTGAKIVTNTMHNAVDYKGNNIKQDLVKWGISENSFHQDWKTTYPFVDYTKLPSTRKGIGRLIAINDWLEKNKDHNWICFDDRNFTDDPRLVLIDATTGIGNKEIQKALTLLSS